jgi:hypothetical protein
VNFKDAITIVFWFAIMFGVIGLGHSNNLVFSPLRLDEAWHGLLIGTIFGLFVVICCKRK